jgi:acyl carrier protein phosphodiesterase
VNYLAHFLLADPEEPLMVGNFMGDGVRGSVMKSVAPEFARGVRFHRYIDTFTDAHYEVSAAKKLLYPSQSKYSGVVLDVLFDHFIARNWRAYHESELNDFAQSCYTLIGRHMDVLPPRSHRFYRYMSAQDVLTEYASRAGIMKVLEGMDHRTRFDSNMVQSMELLDEIEGDLETHFARFFPQLRLACDQWKKEH